MDPRPEWMHILQRSFAMLALAIISATKTREELATLPPEFRAEWVPDAVAVKLRERMLRGDVTCIRPNPEPFTFVFWLGSWGSVRCVWGMWLERPASWRGKIEAPKRQLITREEAISRGIPLPE